jgi:hypothetical protein
LQALELTNGATLSKMLAQAADRILSPAPATTPALVDSLYQKALSRLPTAPEREIAAQLVGSPAKCDGVEDLLWALTMLPEFQLIN